MSADRRPPRRAGIAGGRRRNSIGGQFSPRLVEMLESPAWRVLSLSAHRVIDRIDVELRHHGGKENGKLVVTFNQFQEYGIHRQSIAPALREAEELGFVEITRRGRGGNAEFRTPHNFRLTFHPTDHGEPTHEWRGIRTMADAERIAKYARRLTIAHHRWADEPEEHIPFP
jgi:hypothetical protein